MFFAMVDELALIDSVSCGALFDRRLIDIASPGWLVGWWARKFGVSSFSFFTTKKHSSHHFVHLLASFFDPPHPSGVERVRLDKSCQYLTSIYPTLPSPSPPKMEPEVSGKSVAPSFFRHQFLHLFSDVFF